MARLAVSPELVLVTQVLQRQLTSIKKMVGLVSLVVVERLYKVDLVKANHKVKVRVKLAREDHKVKDTMAPIDSAVV